MNKMGQLSCILLLFFAPAACTGQGQPPARNLLHNGDFSAGLDGWEFRPGVPDMVRVETVEGVPGRAVHFFPRGKLLGLNSAPLAVGREILPDRTYRIAARVRFDGLESGTAALSVCFYDKTGKRIRQFPITAWTPKSKPHPWRLRWGVVGPGTACPVEPQAASMRVRLSFYARDGRCNGDIWLADVQVQPWNTGEFADWPASILVDCGDIQTRFESRSFWTLYRIDYRGKRLGLDRFGSHYGTVANIAGVGFIGSGHTENGETEQVEELELTVDGNRLDPPPAHVSGKTVVLRKTSRIRSLRLDTTVTVLPDRIIEAVEMTAEKPVRVNRIYHFMHPWVTAMNRFLAVRTDGTTIEGAFTGDKKMKVDAPVRWSAVYSDTLGMGAVTLVVEAPADADWRVWYWDVPDRYRKHYFLTFRGKTVPSGKTFRYKIVTRPFAAAPDRWQEEARRLAGEVTAETH